MSQTKEIVLLTLLGIPPEHLTSIPHAAGNGDKKLTAEQEEAQRIAEMGKPVLGENSRLEVIIEESYDFKVTFLGLPFPEACPELCRVGGWRDEIQESNANLKVGDHSGVQLQHCGMHLVPSWTGHVETAPQPPITPPWDAVETNYSFYPLFPRTRWINS